VREINLPEALVAHSIGRISRMFICTEKVVLVKINQVSGDVAVGLVCGFQLLLEGNHGHQSST